MNDENPIDIHAPAGAIHFRSAKDELFANHVAAAMAVLVEAVMRPGQPGGMPLQTAAFVLVKALDHVLQGAGVGDAEARRTMYRELAGVFDDAPESDSEVQEIASDDELAVSGPVKVWAEDDPEADLERTVLQVRAVAAANAALIRLALRAGEPDGIALIDATHIGYLTGALVLEIAGVSPETRAELLDRARWFYEGVQPFLIRPAEGAEDAVTLNN